MSKSTSDSQLGADNSDPEEDGLPSWDVFISHASEDKANLVRPLADQMINLGVAAWYDEFELKPGDSLRRSIDAGLRQSKAGVIVISKAFIAKKWTQYELDGLNALAIHADRRIVPIWHDVEYSDVLNFSPPLADRVAIQTRGLDVPAIALKISEVIRPDLFQKTIRRRAYEEILKTAKVVSIETKKIRVGPVRTKEFSREVLTQIRLIRAALLPIYPHSLEFWVDGFSRDMRPEREIEWWMHVAACAMEYLSVKGLQDHISKDELQNVLFAVAMNGPVDLDRAKQAGIDVEFIQDSVSSILPALDFEEPPFGSIWGDEEASE